MTEKEAIEELKEQIKTAESMISFNADFEPEHDNSVLENKIKTAKTAISAIEEIQQYRAIGTIEECREARKRQKIEEDADPVRQMVSIPSTDEAFKADGRKKRKTVKNICLYGRIKKAQEGAGKGSVGVQDHSESL